MYSEKFLFMLTYKVKVTNKYQGILYQRKNTKTIFTHSINKKPKLQNYKKCNQTIYFFNKS